MKRVLSYRINAAGQKENVGQFLREKGYSRHILSHLKNTQNGIVCNGDEVRTSHILREGDTLVITILEEKSSENIVPVPMPLHMIYEDEDIAVIDKPADMPIHPSINNYDNTLANALAAYYQQQGENFVYRCINRLDRDTTGLLIVAKNMLSGAILSDMVKKREIHREYLAIACGQTPPEGCIDAPIARREGSVLERCVDFERGEHAVTHYKTLAYKNGYSLVSLKLETGRTHQIRVHMKYLGYPLTGDYLYHPDYTLMDHQALHSYRLAFKHPITGADMEFTVPPGWEF